MDYFEDQVEEKLYDKKISKFLLGYIMKYKAYVFVSLFFIFIITGVSLVVPYISKVFLDRYVVKNGFLAYPEILEENLFPKNTNLFIRKRIEKGVRLDHAVYFYLQSDLRYFSKSELEALKKNQILSSETFMLIESEDHPTEEFKKFVGRLAVGQKAFQYDDKYLVAEDTYRSFNLQDLLIVRQYDISLIKRVVVFIILAFAVQFVATYFQMILLQKLAQFSMRDLRHDLFSRLLTYEISYYDSNQIGKLVNRVSNDIEVLNEFFSEVLVSLFRDIILISGIIIFMFWQNVRLAIAVSAVFPAIIVLIILFRVKSANAYRKVRTIIARINAFFSEAISGIRIVQLFSAEKKIYRKFNSINSSLCKANIRQMYVYATFRPFIDFLRWFTVASVIYFGARGILSYTVSYGLIFLFTQYIASLFEPIGDLSEKFDIMISANAAGEKILSVFEASARHEKDGNNEIVLFKERNHLNMNRGSGEDMRFNGRIDFQNVWFSYKPDEWILKDVSFSIKPRQTIAIVGETGAGKSTIISLLARFYEIQKGAILIDNMPVNSIPYGFLRRNISIVMQDVFLFAKTVRENIILNSGFDAEKFRRVCEMTHVDNFIARLPDKENEMVMERGVTFSAGERQLLSFARALYFDPTILILDEATSNIDSETEKLIQDAIRNLIRDRTAVVIAHRLSTIKSADAILVLENGRVVEAGSHAELISRKGIYYTLYKLQFEPV